MSNFARPIWTGGPSDRRALAGCAMLIAAILVVAEVGERIASAESAGALPGSWRIAGIGLSCAVAAAFLGSSLVRVPPALASAATGASLGGVDGPLPLRAEAGWFITSRWVATLGVVVAMLIAMNAGGVLPYDAWPRLEACTVGLGLFNLVVTAALPRIRRFEQFLFAQAAVDLLFLTLMLHFAGGIENPFHGLYLLHVLLAAALLPPRLAYAITGLASLLLLALGLSEGFGVVERYPIALGYHRAPMRVGTATLAPLGMAARLTSGLLLMWVAAFFAVALRSASRAREAQILGAGWAVRDLNRQLGLVVDSIGASLSLWTSPTSTSWSNRDARVNTDASSVDGGGGEGGFTRALVAAAFETGRDAEEERAVSQGADRVVHLNARAVALHGEGGDVDMVLLVVQDVTAHRAMEAEILHATKMAVLGRVAAGMAHEIGNPLASMAMRLRLLSEDPSPAFAMESARLLQTQVERINRLVQSVRRFGKPASAGRGPCSVGDVVQEVVRVLHLDPRARNVVIGVTAADLVPPVLVGRDQLTQVLLNLCINALEAIGGVGELRIDTGLAPGAVVVRVRDTGPGIPLAVRANLFRAFYTTKPDGSGLGLFLSRRLMCEIGGDIEVIGDAGPGATLEVRLPVHGGAASTTEVFL